MVDELVEQCSKLALINKEDDVVVLENDTDQTHDKKTLIAFDRESFHRETAKLGSLQTHYASCLVLKRGSGYQIYGF